MIELFHRQLPLVPIRAVHLDLKGVPPTPTRLLSLLDLFAACRINAVLVEWEDMFPWTVDERFRIRTAYSSDDIQRFREKSAALGIEIIPLVQCLGHMETPLSLDDYAHLRLRENDSSCLNPLADGARELIQSMVDDVLTLLPDTRHFHLGGDEAWGLTDEPDTKAYADAHGKGQLYMQHVGPILDSLNARDIRPILWHDMMNEWEDAALNDLAGRADLMPWGYQGHPDDSQRHYNPRYMTRFQEHGITMWGGTAYKGADGHNIDRPDLSARLTNALGWAEMAERYGMKGLCATAWSRYSTHRLQCEPIDACLDALVAVAVVMHDGEAPEGGIDACVEALESVGEKERFLACKNAMDQLTALRNHGWNAIKQLAEQRVMERLEPRRGTSVHHLAKALKAAVNRIPEVEKATIEAFSGLVDPYWLNDYLETRLAPIREITNKQQKLL